MKITIPDGFDILVNIKHAVTNAVAGVILGAVFAASFGLPFHWGAIAFGIYGLLGGSANDLICFIRNNKPEKEG